MNHLFTKRVFTAALLMAGVGGLMMLQGGLLLADEILPPLVASNRVPAQAYAFDLNQVHLLDGPFKHAQTLDRQYLLDLNVDLMLYPFRREAKLPSPVKGSNDLGWVSTGHMLGHYLSACALMYRNTGDVELKKRADGAVAVLAECQAKIGNGYVGGFPERSILELEKLIKDPSVHAGVPWYCLHKVYAGLLDMYTLADNRQALSVLEKTADWIEKNTSQLNDQQMQKMLGIEHGGMNEVLANLYAVTGKEKYLKLAQRFNHHAVIDPFARGQDPLNNLHANTQFPKFIGIARQYELTGDATLKTIANGFWSVVTEERSYVTGGNSEWERFCPKAHLSYYVHSYTTESCNSYNMLKLTRYLFCQDSKAAYADYYERTLLNHILAAQHPKTGDMLYYLPLQSGGRKGESGSSDWSVRNESPYCCHGTGVESHAKYADSIYFQNGEDGLFVNLFIASVLDWKAKGLTLRQETSYPDQGAARFLFTCEKPLALNVNVRRPWWATADFQILINGRKQEIASTPGSYVQVKRTWQSGDTMEVVMPMTLHMEGFKDNPKRAAVMYGPLVMAALTGAKNRFSAIYAEDEHFLESLKPVAGKSLEFAGSPAVFRTSPLVVGSEAVVFKPLFRMVDETYAVYWDVCSPNQFERFPGAFQSEANRQKALESRTVDLVLCMGSSEDLLTSGKYTFQRLLLGQTGLIPRSLEQVSEDAHDLKIGQGTNPMDVNKDFQVNKKFQIDEMCLDNTGCWLRCIPAKSWFSYRMRVLPDQEQRLQVRIWHPELDGQGRSFNVQGSFDVLVEGKVIGTCNTNSQPVDQFFDVSYPIPMELTKGKEQVTIAFRAAGDVRGFYECRILKK